MEQKKPPLSKPVPAKGKSAPVQPSFLKDDFPLIRKALLTLGASLLLSATLIVTSRAILLKLQDDMNQAQVQRNDANNKRRQAEIDKQEIQDYQPKYLRLRERGFVGEEKRLDWMEHIKSIRDSWKLLPIAYEISAQQPFQIGPSVPTGDLELRGSKMKLQMALLHELDLLNFLDDLSSKGFYTVRECTVKRAGVVLENSQSPRLTAECTLYWLTLGERTAGRGEAPNPVEQ